MRSRHQLLVALIAVIASSAAANAVAASGPPALIPADGGERFDHLGGVLVLKVGPRNSGATQVFVGTMDLPAGVVIPTHRHDTDEEVLYILEGEVVVLLNDRELQAKTGDTVFIPVGTWMTVRNSGARRARLLGIIPRAEMETCMRLSHGNRTTPVGASTIDPVADVCRVSAPPPGQRK